MVDKRGVAEEGGRKGGKITCVCLCVVCVGA